MIQFDIVTGENIKEHNSIWHQIPHYPDHILIIEGSRSRKKILLLMLINHQPDIDKIH